MGFLKDNKWKTKKDRIRNHTARIGLGIIPLKEKTELAELRWFVGVV
jgi:hypothetical protein